MLSIDDIFASETKPKIGRDQDKTIAFPLAKNSLDQIRIGIKESQDLDLIRAYLSAQGESGGRGEKDESVIAEYLQECRINPSFMQNWLHDAKEWKAKKGQKSIPVSMPNKPHVLVQCTTCKYLKRPGKSSGYCGGGREDLDKAYGINHPLRKLPKNGGANCEKWAWDEW